MWPKNSVSPGRRVTPEELARMSAAKSGISVQARWPEAVGRRFFFC